MPLIRIGDQEIYYAARGRKTGVPLVFIHGAGDSHLLWNGQLGALSDVACTIALDLPGHGRSPGQGRQSIGEYAAIVHDFLRALDYTRATFIGASMGGAITLTLALETPECVAALGLVCTGGRLRVAPAILKGLEDDFEAAARQLVENYYAPGVNSALKANSLKELLTSAPKVVLDDFNACDNFDVLTRLSEIHSPTLVICGEQDRMTPPKYSQTLAAQIPHSELAVVPDAGHMIMLEQPNPFNRLLRYWIVEVSNLTPF